ncbi:MAG: oligopeptide/dipeptide transporter, ATPase subunit [Bradyrhizobium sp.]|nr:oligopeptide/dipeptide transporter, ATPase subunit [Bradyrhizobium sp.]
MNDHESAAPLVDVADVSKIFVSRQGWFRRKELQALRSVSFSIRKGQTLGVVGESGSGKSTIGRIVAGLVSASSGRIRVGELAVEDLKGSARKRLWRETQMVFQDPYSSLNPRMSVHDILAEPLRNFKISRGRNADERIRMTLDACGLTASASRRYPSEFSGGQRQRIAIARALIMRPNFIIADEPTSALDVSLQAQIVNLLMDLKEDFKLTYMFISHDLAVVRQISDQTAVMYAGDLVEIGDAEDIYTAPKHPYTQLLLRSIPFADPVREARRRAERPLAIAQREAGAGCPFYQRCPLAQEICAVVRPSLTPAGPGRLVACHVAESAEVSVRRSAALAATGVSSDA